MKAQSLSIVVPTKGCVNNCPFCVSKTHRNVNINFTEEQVFSRLKYAKDVGINNVILTGTGEALQNYSYMQMITRVNYEIGFQNIELQTTGVMLHEVENLRFLADRLQVKTISISICDIFNDEANMEYMQVPENLRFKLKDLIYDLKIIGFNIRLSINLLGIYSNKTFTEVHNQAKTLGADQVTFRKLWKPKEPLMDDGISGWISSFGCHEEVIIEYSDQIKHFGVPIRKLMFGTTIYSVDGIAYVVDEDCMSDELLPKDEVRYFILQADGKLYTKWNDKGSLIF